VPKVASKLLWRAGFLASKLCGRSQNVPWSLALRSVSERHPPRRRVSIEVVEIDITNQMVLLSIGANQYWYPSDASTALLSEIHSEVFDPWSPHFYECRGAYLVPDDTVLDAGSCEGFFVRYALDRGCNVVAVEPWTRMARCLERTFAREIDCGRVKVVSSFLGREAGECELVVDLDFPFGASDSHGESPSCLETERVRVTSIDELVSSSNLGRIDFMKMDIEGAEQDALQGASMTIRQFRPRVSVTTYHAPQDWLQIPRQLHALNPGYEFWLKGVIHYHPEGWRPLMLHAWPKEGAVAQ
jgi:FkbM family methyltransferase